MRFAVIMSFMVLSSCTSVQGVIDNKEIYCSQFYKGIRAVGRSALSATAGVVVPDVCDTIDEIVAEEDAEGVSKSDS
jgi:ethanolamine transporter EutH